MHVVQSMHGLNVQNWNICL